MNTNGLGNYRVASGLDGSLAPAAAAARQPAMLRRSIPGMLALVLLGLAPTAEVRADEARDGRRLAATCANCHGTDGRSQGVIPDLAGYPADRLVATLADFKSGKKPATIMHQIAKGYTDAQISSVAAYFAAQRN